jgi:hypothetical protein
MRTGCAVTACVADSGSPVDRNSWCSVKAPPLSGRFAGQGTWRPGSPEQRRSEEVAEMPRGNDVRRWGRLHGGHQRPWRAPVAWMRWAVSRGAVGCEGSKLREALTDEGGRWRSSGGIRCSPEPLGRRRWTGASRGRKRGRRCGARAQTRGKGEKRDGRQPMSFMVTRW